MDPADRSVQLDSRVPNRPRGRHVMHMDGAIAVACFSGGLFVWALIERRKCGRAQLGA